MENKELDRSTIYYLLSEVGKKLEERNLHATVNIVGGAAIALTLRDNRITQDVDAMIFTDHGTEFNEIARQVALENNIQSDWIGDDISDFISREPEGDQTEIVLPGIDLYVASPQHLFAMKVRSATTRYSNKDADDLVYLFEHMQLKTPDEGADMVMRQFSGIYQDNVNHQDCIDTIENAFLTHDLENKINPMDRIETWNKRRQIKKLSAISDNYDIDTNNHDYQFD